MANFSYSKKFLGVADVFLRSPATYKPLLDFLENIMVGNSALTKAEREIIAAHVSNVAISINRETFQFNDELIHTVDRSLDQFGRSRQRVLDLTAIKGGKGPGNDCQERRPHTEFGKETANATTTRRWSHRNDSIVFVIKRYGVAPFWCIRF